MKNVFPIILCCGANGRAVVYGWVEKDPVPGKPVTLYDARMVLRWEGSGGLFGLAAKGPEGRSRITASVERVVETSWQEHVIVSPKAAQALDDWPAA